MKVRFVARDGSVSEAEGAPGERLLDVAWRTGQPLEGTCEGEMACGTCHVIVDPADYATLPPPTADEEDMLDLAWGASRTSRLACQIAIDDCGESLTVRLPGS